MLLGSPPFRVVLLLCWLVYFLLSFSSSRLGEVVPRTGPVGVNSYILKFLTELSPHCVYNFVFYPLKVSARGENVSFFLSGVFAFMLVVLFSFLQPL